MFDEEINNEANSIKNDINNCRDNGATYHHHIINNDNWSVYSINQLLKTLFSPTIEVVFEREINGSKIHQLDGVKTSEAKLISHAHGGTFGGYSLMFEILDK